MQQHRLVVHRSDVHQELEALGTRLLVRCRYDHIGLAARIRDRIDFENTLVRNFDLEFSILALCGISQRIAFRILEPGCHNSLRVLQSSCRREVFGHSRIERFRLHDNSRKQVALVDHDSHNSGLRLRTVDNGIVAEVIDAFKAFFRLVREATIFTEGKRTVSRLLRKFCFHALRDTFRISVVGKDALLCIHCQSTVVKRSVLILYSLSHILRGDEFHIQVHAHRITTIRCVEENRCKARCACHRLQRNVIVACVHAINSRDNLCSLNIVGELLRTFRNFTVAKDQGLSRNLDLLHGIFVKVHIESKRILKERAISNGHCRLCVNRQHMDNHGTLVTDHFVVCGFHKHIGQRVIATEILFRSVDERTQLREFRQLTMLGRVDRHDQEVIAVQIGT